MKEYEKDELLSMIMGLEFALDIVKRYIYNLPEEPESPCMLLSEAIRSGFFK